MNKEPKDEVSPPRVFISYSWNSAAYGERVVELAERLMIDGVEVVLDRWDLREGQDKHAFMEKAVTDSGISRVLVLCDPVYAAKADQREGGVGTETLIISPEVYGKADQHKFIPVIMERDDEGNVRVPQYLKGRIYIDLSNAETELQHYESLIRNLHGKPELQKPPLGKAPSYLQNDAIVLKTGRTLAMFRDGTFLDLLRL